MRNQLQFRPVVEHGRWNKLDQDQDWVPDFNRGFRFKHKLKYYKMSNEIADTGSTFYDRQLGKSGLAGLLGIVPWWVWPLVAVAAVVYFWPALRPLFNRLR